MVVAWSKKSYLAKGSWINSGERESGVSHQPAFMVSCLTIFQTVYLVHVVDRLDSVKFRGMVGKRKNVLCSDWEG